MTWVRVKGTGELLLIEEILHEVQILPDESKAILVEKLVASIEEKVDQQVSKMHSAYNSTPL